MRIKILIVFCLTEFITAVRPPKRREDDSTKLNRFCSAGSNFVNAYNENCVPTFNEESPVVAMCAVVADRFRSARDIPEVEQKENLRRTRSLGTEQGDLCHDRDGRLEVILNNIDHAITFMSTLQKIKYNSAIIGLRSVQGQIALLRPFMKEGTVPPTLLAKMITIEMRCKDVAIMLEDNNSIYFNRADQTTSSTFFWKSPTTWLPWHTLAIRKLQTAPQLRNLTDYKRDHHINNECHIRMMRDCDLTQECARVLMDSSAEITTLDHITEYFRLAIKMQCTKEVGFVNKFPNGGWETFVENNCGKMLDEASVVASANFPMGFKGLFLIHGSLCGMMGYPNFLRVDWMRSVMDWMDSTVSGCIAPDTNSGEGDLELGYDSLGPSGEWCTIYETAMGMQLLAMHVRYVIETCSQAHQQS